MRLLFLNVVHRMPIKRKLALIVLPFALGMLGLLAAAWFCMEMLSGVRAYVGGEGLWSKAQKGAVYRLSRYAIFKEPDDYHHYKTLIQVPLGDRQARLEMMKKSMDRRRVADGFIRGRNHPGDVPSMIVLARNFHDVKPMARAIAIWAEADERIAELEILATQLHDDIRKDRLTPAKSRDYLRRLQTLDDRLTPLEDDFSYALGEGARWLKKVAMTALFLSAALLLGLALAIAFSIGRRLTREIDQLREGVRQMSEGRLPSEAPALATVEMGELSHAFHDMARQRFDAERLKDEFFANVSHELRTPLTLILSPLESLLVDIERMPPATREALQTIHNNAVRLLQLVNGLLDFARLEAGKLEVKREPVDVARLTESIFHDFEPWFQRSGLQAALDMPSDIGSRDIDRYLYERILFNLLSNAIKFTPAPGRVDVKVRVVPDQLEVRVTDTGIGMTDAQQRSIFQRFRQVEGASTRRYEGTGIGLALVKEFAQLLDGDVSVASHPGQGSTFSLVCRAPASVRPAEGPQESARYNKPVLPKPSVLAEMAENDRWSPDTGYILIAEDNAELASYMAKLLRSLGRIRIAPDGEEALQMALAETPDLILTDIMMPRRDGYSLCREIRHRRDLQNVPVLMLTALTHREALMEGWKAGATDYLYKPFHPRELEARVESLLVAVRQRRRYDAQIEDLVTETQRRAETLEESNRELDAFNHSVSHDLRAPLRAIDGFAEALTLDLTPALNAEQNDQLRRIRQAAQHMGHLIDDLLAFSRSGRVAMTSAPVSMTSVVQSVVKEVSDQNPQRTIRWTVNDLPDARGDAALIRQVIVNLLSNAAKFTRAKETAAIEISGRRLDDGRCEYRVRDNGVGFDMRYAGRLFDIFRRLHKPEEYEGTGVGLSIAYRIVRRHGGRIWAEAQVDAGATFFFTLPDASAAQNPVSESPRRAA